MMLLPGTELHIGYRNYVVQPGDTIATVAERVGESPQRLLELVSRFAPQAIVNDSDDFYRHRWPLLMAPAAHEEKSPESIHPDMRRAYLEEMERNAHILMRDGK